MRAIGLALVVGAAACANDGGGGIEAARREEGVTLSFAARFGDVPFSCATTATGMGTTGATVAPLDFRVYVHDVRLITADGGEVPVHLVNDDRWQGAGVALLDFEDRTGTCLNGTPETNTALRGTVAAGDYTGLKLRIGVPRALNHADAARAPSPLNVSALYWGWNAGYKFARIDGRVVAPPGASEGQAFAIHLGSVHCAPSDDGSPRCERPDVGEVVLRGVDPRATTILVDYRALVAGTDLTADRGGAPGCMSDEDDPECPELLARLGVNPASGAPDATRQALFRLE